MTTLGILRMCTLPLNTITLKGNRSNNTCLTILQAYLTWISGTRTYTEMAMVNLEMDPQTAARLLRLVTSFEWDRKHQGIYRSCFVASVLLVLGGRDLCIDNLFEEKPFPGIAESNQMISDAVAREKPWEGLRSNI